MNKDETLKQTLEAFEALIDKFSDVSAYEDEEHAFTDELIFIPNIKKAIKAIAAAKEALSQPPAGRPVREPVATISITRRGTSTTIDDHFEDCVRDWPEGEYKLVLAPSLPVQPDERNFCPRCGKRTADLTTIHTCTPPQIDPNQWAFDNGLEST